MNPIVAVGTSAIVPAKYQSDTNEDSVALAEHLMMQTDDYLLVAY